MKRIVLDTMVLASGFTSLVGASGWLVQQWRAGSFSLVVSEHILAELRRTLSDDAYFRVRINPEEVEVVMSLLRAEAIVTEISEVVIGVATQPKDDLVLATGLSGGASYLVTRDRQLLKVRAYLGLSIVSPGELRAMLEDIDGIDA